jgi:hypothetical protein
MCENQCLKTTQDDQMQQTELGRIKIVNFTPKIENGKRDKYKSGINSTV